MKKRIYAAIFLIIMIICCGITGFASSTDDRVVIKVGYYPNYGTLNVPTIRGSEGYGYEYLNEVIKYTDNNYTLEFIECTTWEEGFELIKSGEIDLFGPINYTEERAAEYLYSADDYGSEFIYLATLNDSSTRYNDIESFATGTVGIQSSTPYQEILEEYLSYNNISTEIILSDMNSFVSEMQEGIFDYCLVSSLQNIDGVKVVESLGTVPFYYITNHDNVELMSDLDAGKEKLDSTDYIFEEQIYIEYFTEGLNSTIDITKDDYDLLHDQTEYIVAYIDNYQPVSYTDEWGEAQGIFIDTMNLLAEEVDLNLTFVAATAEEMESIDYDIAMTTDSDADRIFSEPYMEFPFVLVEYTHSRENLDVVGVLDYYDLDKSGVTSYLDGTPSIAYEDFESLGKAFDNGKISSMIVSNVGFNIMCVDLDLEEYVMTPLGIGLSLDMVFAEDFSVDKVEIINQLLSHIDENERSYLMVKHMSVDWVVESLNLYDYIKENPMIIGYVVIGIAIIIIFIERRKKKVLTKILDYDEVTGLYTQHKFIKNTRMILDNQNDKTFNVVSIDIDNFKYINEIYGYEKGTEVLKQLGGYIKERTKSKCLVARIYSDNFLMLIEGTVNKKSMSEQLFSEEVNVLFRKLLGESYHVYFSIGVYEVKNRDLGLNYMVDCANLARAEGKSKSETTINYFTDTMRRERESNNEIVSRMERAISNQEFVLFFQPKLNLRTNRIVGIEALTRWMCDGTIIPPNEFIPIFEKNGFVEKLDYFVLAKTCEFIKQNQALCLPKISINLSAVTIVQEELVENVLNIVTKYDVDPCRLELEVTESAFVDDFKCSNNNLDKLREKGFLISMDDFGTGISSLDRLHGLNIDVLKIDRSFIVNSIDDGKGAIIIESVIKMAQAMN
ncbi:MAG: EAL domain-containing protein, partial [Eubacteriales bacterium]